MNPFRLLPLALGIGLSSPPLGAQPLGTAFTLQGQLTESGQPASGLYDLQVCLFDTPTNPLPLACAPDFGDVPVDQGVFTIALDFGATAFVGQQRFLELRVRPGASSAGYTLLSPRQVVRATPEALRAGVASAAPWSGLTGVPAGFADGIDNDSGGTVTSITAGTGLSGGTINGSGTIGIANGGVGATQIAINAVDGARIADGSVAAVDVAADSLGAAQIATNAVAAAELADHAVDTDAVQDLAITRAKIAAGAVGLAQVDTTQVQARITGTCAVGEYFRGVRADGGLACEPVPGVPRISTVLTDTPLLASMAVGADGLPVIAYVDLDLNRLRVVQCANAACTAVATSAVVDQPANVLSGPTPIAIGADDLPVIAYVDETAGAIKVAKCADPACTGPATITTVDDSTGTVGASPSIAVGADGLPVISYQDITAGALKVAKCANAACSGTATITIVDDPTNVVGRFNAIAVGADNLPVIAYHDDTAGALKAAKCANAACTGAPTLTVLDDPVADVGEMIDIAIGADGLPIISYRDTTAAALKVARCASAACAGATITTLDDPPNSVGAWTSIAIGGDGLPVVSYQDFTANTVKLARCTNADCSGAPTIATVDDPGTSVGRFTSLAIGSDGLPVISYYDFTLGTLKVAKCGTRSCL